MSIDMTPYVLPAYAGMIRRRPDRRHRTHGAPRVCGDDPWPLEATGPSRPCSPRMRG